MLCGETFTTGTERHGGKALSVCNARRFIPRHSIRVNASLCLCVSVVQQGWRLFHLRRIRYPTLWE